MMGLRDLYKVFSETRRASRERATLAVVGDSPRVGEIADLLGAERTMRRAELILTVSGDEISLSGKAVEDVGGVPLPPPGSAEELAPGVVAALYEGYLVPLAKGYPTLRRAACERIIKKNARENALIGLLPIPGADMPVMTANQARMVLHLAAAYGEDLSWQRARELTGVLAAGFGLRALTRQVVKVVPVGGWAASAAVGYAGTVAMGRSTMLYFERGGQKVGQEEMEEIRRRAAEEAKGFVSRLRRRWSVGNP
jgi:uncharacterized protein (DUF697 family)